MLLLLLHTKFSRSCSRFIAVKPYSTLGKQYLSRQRFELDSSQKRKLLEEIGERHTSEIAYLYSGAHILESCLDRFCIVCPGIEKALSNLLTSDIIIAAYDLKDYKSTADSTACARSHNLTALFECSSKGSEEIIEENAHSIAMTQQIPSSSNPDLNSQGRIEENEDQRQELVSTINKPQLIRDKEGNSESIKMETNAIQESPVVQSTISKGETEEDQDMMCTCVVCYVSQPFGLKRKDTFEIESDPNDPLGLVALVQQGNVHLQCSTTLSGALHYELPLRNNRADKELTMALWFSQQKLTSLKKGTLYSLVSNQMGKLFGEVQYSVQTL